MTGGKGKETDACSEVREIRDGVTPGLADGKLYNNCRCFTSDGAQTKMSRCEKCSSMS
jgi:hypothetical protein